MDDLTLLRGVEADPPPLSPPARTRARARLEDEIARAGRRAPRPAGRRPRIGLGIAAAVVCAGLLAFAGIGERGGGDSPPDSTQYASAAPVLFRAAAHARGEAAPRYRGDQYLYTREHMEEVPVDGRGATREFTNEYWRSADGSRKSLIIERGRRITEAPVQDGAVWPPRGREAVEELPTEPGALLEAVLDWFGRGNSAAVDQESQYMGLMMLMRGGRLLPPDLRAGAFEALARIPGVEVMAGDMDAQGRRGVGLTRPSQPHQGDLAMILDSRTYEYLGTRMIDSWPDGTRIYQYLTIEDSGIVDGIGERP